MSLNQNKRLLFFTLSWTNRLSLVMHCQKNVSLSTHIDMFEWIITNFAGSCPGYIPRKLRLAVCMFHILGLQIFLTEQIVFNTFKCRHCIYWNSILRYINVTYNVQAPKLHMRSSG